MSRPYLNINSMSYTAPVLSMNWTYFKTRGGGSYTITGFSNSITFTDTDSNNASETLTFSVPGALGMPSDPTSTFSDPYITYNVTGTASLANTARVYVNGVTASTSVAGTSSLTTWLTAIANSFDISATLTAAYPVGNWTASVTMTSATAGSITFAPYGTGNYYNNTTNLVVSGLAASASSITSSVVSNTFSGGVTNYNVTLSYVRLGGLDLSTNGI